jgi:hypothetical protein
MVEASRRDLVAILTSTGSTQGAFHRRVAGRSPAQVGQDPTGVQQRGGLDDPGDHEVPEHLVSERVEPQTGEHLREGVEQDAGVGAHHPARTITPTHRRSCTSVEQRWRGNGCEQRRHRRGRVDLQIQDPLAGIAQQVIRLLQKHPELGLGMRRPDVLHDPLPSTGVLGDLHRRRPRRRPHPPDERHPRTLEEPRLVREDAPSRRRHRRSQPCGTALPRTVSQLRTRTPPAS